MVAKRYSYIMIKKLRIATRSSPLAIAQAQIARDALISVDTRLAEPGLIDIIPIQTTGHKMQRGSLTKIGGKGLFTKEIEDALLEDRVDIAVHSMKDMPTALPPGLRVVAVLPREDTRDALISNNKKIKSIEDLPSGACVGTASLRRSAILKNKRPDIKITNLRGNIQTRLKKVEAGDFDATFLAVAGLKRLGLLEKMTGILDFKEMLPAVGQGALGIECRKSNSKICELIDRVNHKETYACVQAERAFLAVLDGSCRTPIGGLATLDGSIFTITGLVIRPDGSEAIYRKRQGDFGNSMEIARAVAADLKSAAGPGFFKEDC